MGDCIIDTNVLLVASACDPQSPFNDADHVSIEQQVIVFNWLIAFRNNEQSKLIIDNRFKIWDEYHNKMTRGRDLGSLIVAEKLQTGRIVAVEYDKDGYGVLPLDLIESINDPSDRKFVAAALADLSNNERSKIINAADSDWCECESALKKVGILVEHLIEGFCDEERPRPAKTTAKKSRGKSKR